MGRNTDRVELAQFAIVATGLALLAMVVILWTTTLLDSREDSVTIPSTTEDGGNYWRSVDMGRLTHPPADSSCMQPGGPAQLMLPCDTEGR